MKLIAFTAAGLLAASALTPAPAEAQRRGWHDDRGWNGDRGWRGERRWRGRDDRRWDRGRGRHWRGDGRRYGYRYRPRQRVVCNIVRGYYGPVRRCFNVWR
ncbi:hypothetical protein [Sphingomonas jeddahensis]|uniref:Sulfur globule protein n=1 Tax=Sphingomonas jeddahensis TaxID=1915074 RepID=A0A1V2F048_9SPHN|nr:hypothetical protein [Sphingomonas jeddahensis]ONF97774.1 hypothetical protein SPHI_04100 [Sphingomonas jeddahensis]